MDAFDKLHADMHVIWEQPALFCALLFLRSLHVLEARETLSKEFFVLRTDLGQTRVGILDETVPESAQPKLN